MAGKKYLKKLLEGTHFICLGFLKIWSLKLKASKIGNAVLEGTQVAIANLGSYKAMHDKHWYS